MNDKLKQLQLLRESEDHVEFKEAKRDFNFNGGSHADPKKRRHCVLGYVAALANEGGGRMVFGMADQYPHQVVGSSFGLGKTGAMEAEIYKHLGIRVHIDEEYDDDKRVMIINIPSRPIGRILMYEGVGLMRAGEELREMSQDEMFAILSENEPDFSEKICDGLSIDDLDPEAIKELKDHYAVKNNNPAFKTLSTEQVLNDLNLMRRGGLTYAALILLGKSEAIRQYLPNNNVVIEYRRYPASIQYDGRVEYQLPLCTGIDKIWEYIAQPALNPQTHLRIKANIYDILLFNEDTVREAVLNAVMHRSFRINSDVVIKLSPQSLVITNAGGFPQGVNPDNILTINSTPRCKLLAEVLQKTGYVEKSGQGVDKLFSNSIMEAKPLPDYTHTDNCQVELVIGSEMRNVPFAMFMINERLKRDQDHQLNVFELLVLYKVCFGADIPIRDEESIVAKLIEEKLLKRKSSGQLALGKGYSDMVTEYSNTYNIDWIGVLKECFAADKEVSRQQYLSRLPQYVTVDRARYVLHKLEEQQVIQRVSGNKWTKYVLIGNLDEVKL